MTKPSIEQLAAMSPKEFRELCRRGGWSDYTIGVCRNYAQNNLAIVPMEYAHSFSVFCQRNPRPCPVVDVTEAGSPTPTLVASDADLRTDLPRYRVFVDGDPIDEPTDVVKYWRDDLVAFLIGCSLTIEWALKAANVPFRLLGAYESNIPCVPAGPFKGRMVVSCRAFSRPQDAVRAIQISSRYLASHGPPIHIGDPAAIGIHDLRNALSPADARPGDESEILLWWGCGITPQLTAQDARLPIFITHKGSHMFVNDLTVEETANL
ncbi:D-glutamate cyclase family protein [Chloroflexota bacterium]